MSRVVVLALALWGAFLVPAQAATVLYRETFDGGTGGWQSVDPADAAPTISTKVSVNGASLESSYEVQPAGKPHILVQPSSPALRGARSIRFQLRVSQTTMMAFLLAQENGARYMTAFQAPAGKWQSLEISVDRFRLADDSEDPGGGLDLAHVSAFGLIDAGSVFPLPDRVYGHRTLWLDEFQIDDDESRTAYSAKHHLPYMLDNFTAEYLSWLSPFGTLALDADKGELAWSYPANKGNSPFPAVMTILGRMPATNGQKLLVTLRSEQARHMLVVLQEEKRGQRPERRYLQPVELVGGPKAQTLVLPVEKFQLDKGDRPNDTKPLELANVSMLSLVDMEVMMGQANGPNVITLQEILLSEE